MPHTPEEIKSALTRLRRIRGQAEALERAIEAKTECGNLLQQLAALRGAVNGLIAEILESHMRETFEQYKQSDEQSEQNMTKGLEASLALIRTYLK